MKEILIILVSATFVNNVIFARFLGICPYIGVSKNLKTATGMGLGVIFVMTLATPITYAVDHAILIPFNAGYMRTAMFILIIASLVQVVELVVKKVSKPLYNALGIYLPLITTNCAILGVAILATQGKYSFLMATFFGFCSALGFTIAIIIFAGIRGKLEEANIPEPFKNVPIAFVTAAILAMAFMGFSGLVK
jgi:electron transport complex protein RnfA